MDKYYLFAGPSAYNLDLAQFPWLINLGPAKQSDILDLIRFADVKHIIIADGLYKSIPAPWHKEILVAINQGISVYGTSSIGALRAAEMSEYGLIGFGEVYTYLQSCIVDDSEVAVVHSGESDSWQPLTVAHVEVHFWVDKLLALGLVDSQTASSIKEISKSIYFERRSFTLIINELLRITGKTDPSKYASHWFSQKQLDLYNLLAKINYNTVVSDPVISNRALSSEISLTPYIVRQQTRDSRPYYCRNINTDLAHISSSFLAFTLLTKPELLHSYYIQSYAVLVLNSIFRMIRIKYPDDLSLQFNYHSFSHGIGLQDLSRVLSGPCNLDLSYLLEDSIRYLDNFLLQHQNSEYACIDTQLLLSTWNPLNICQDKLSDKYDKDATHIQLFIRICDLFLQSYLQVNGSLTIISDKYKEALTQIICDNIIIGKSVDTTTLNLAFKIKEELECYTIYHHHSRAIILNRILTSHHKDIIKDEWEHFISSKPAEYPHSFYIESSERAGIIRSMQAIESSLASWPFLTKLSHDNLTYHYLDTWQLIYTQYVIDRRDY